MKVQITDGMGQNLNVIHGDTDNGLIVQYTNKITGKEDPYVNFGGGRIVHFSTIESRGWYLKTDLGQIVTPHDLKGVNSVHKRPAESVQGVGRFKSENKR